MIVKYVEYVNWNYPLSTFTRYCYNSIASPFPATVNHKAFIKWFVRNKLKPMEMLGMVILQDSKNVYKTIQNGWHNGFNDCFYNLYIRSTAHRLRIPRGTASFLEQNLKCSYLLQFNEGVGIIFVPWNDVL